MSKEKPFPTKSIEEVQKDLGIIEEELEVAGLEILYEKIFKFLWPDKCWHITKREYLGATDWEVYVEDVCAKCGDKSPFNSDLDTPFSMVMILDRLKEMGYSSQLESVPESRACQYYFEIFRDYRSIAEGDADTAPLAVISAVESLIRKEEEGE